MRSARMQAFAAKRGGLFYRAGDSHDTGEHAPEFVHVVSWPETG